MSPRSELLHVTGVPTPRRSGRRRAVILLGVLLGAVVGLGAPASPASAHAILVTADPPQGSVVGSLPAAVELTFNEPVQIVPGRIQVIAPDGKRISAGEPRGAGERVIIALRAGDQLRGTYLVSYRVISADSHPVGASYTFSVEAPSQSPPAPPADGGDPAVNAAVSAAKFLGYAGLLLAVGPVLLLATVWPRRLPAAGPLRLARAGLLLLAVGALGGLWAQIPYVSGAGLSDVTWPEVRQVLTSQFGLVMLVRLAAVAAATVLLSPQLRRGAPNRRPRLLGLLAVAVAGLLTWPLAGHPISSPQPWVMSTAAVVHLAGMAIWLGGLVTLLAFLLRRAQPRELGVILPVWSRWAALAVYFLVAGGVIQALVEAGPLHLLPDHRYGQLLLLKIGLVAAVLVVAGFARHLARRRASRGDTPRRLRRTLAVEVAVTAVVLAASAVLAHTPTGRVASFETVAARGAQGYLATLESPVYFVQVEIFPGQVGEYNTFHAFVYAPDGRPIAPEEWIVRTTLPERDIEPIEHQVATLRDNEGLGSVTFPLAGEWELHLTIRISEIDQATVTTTIPIAPVPPAGQD